MKLIEKTVSSQTVFEGKIITVLRDVAELPDGNTATREVVRHPGGVCMAAVDDERNVYMVEQFRYPVGEVVLELPAGKLEWGEEPDGAAVRELKEETGLTAKTMRRMGAIFPSPGYGAERLYIYVATGLSAGEQKLDAEEFLNVKKLPLKKAVEMVMRNEIKDAKTSMLLMMADRLLCE